ncbi:MAG: cytochrome c biogenesis protein [Parcubacteria group bacterium]|jgi:cytochrome c biogenesis protein CcdA/glutaredoxin-related protein
MKKYLLLTLLVLIFPALVFAQTEKKKAIYFYSNTCPHCLRVEKYFEDNGIFEKYDIKKIETSSAKEFDYLNEFFDAFGIVADKRGYPVVFFDDKIIIGDQPIIDSFVSEIETVAAADFPDPVSLKKSFSEQNNNDVNSAIKEDKETSVAIPVLLGAALVDAINPCAFAVLILLVATIIASQSRKKALLAGLLFSFSVFISYFLMGLGLYSAIGAFNLPKIISIIVGIVAIILGLANLKDFFWYGKGFVMEVPFSWRPRLQSLIKGVTSPIGAFGTGFLVSLFLLPCTSGPYLVILGLMAKKTEMAKAVSLLLLYNIIFIMPMIIITLAMYLGVRAKKLEEFRQKNIKVLHLIAGAVMLFIGVYLLYEWLK